jgi:hypothetical protein
LPLPSTVGCGSTEKCPKGCPDNSTKAYAGGIKPDPVAKGYAPNNPAEYGPYSGAYPYGPSLSIYVPTPPSMFNTICRGAGSLRRAYPDKRRRALSREGGRGKKP